jgi:hypothetical protein
VPPLKGVYSGPAKTGQGVGVELTRLRQNRLVDGLSLSHEQRLLDDDAG